MRSRGRASLLAVAFLTLVAVPASSRAAYDPLASGATKLSLDPSFLSAMRDRGITLTAVAPATMKGGVVTFPVSGGKFDPLSGKGTMKHEGALLFRSGRRKIPLKDLQLKTSSRRAPFSVKAGGGQLKLGAVKSLDVFRAGFGDRVRASSLAMSAKVATRLGKKLRLKGVFQEGLPLGRAVTNAVPETVTLLPGSPITLTLDPGFVSKLDSLFVAVNPIFPAEHVGPVFTLPVSGGSIAVNGAQGAVETEGAIEALQLGGGQLFWREPGLDLSAATFDIAAATEAAPGQEDRAAVAGLVPTAPAVADPKARTIALAATLDLDGATAATFNEAFAKPQGKKDVFAAGEVLGTVSLTVQAQ